MRDQIPLVVKPAQGLRDVPTDALKLAGGILQDVDYPVLRGDVAAVRQREPLTRTQVGWFHTLTSLGFCGGARWYSPFKLIVSPFRIADYSEHRAQKGCRSPLVS